MFHKIFYFDVMVMLKVYTIQFVFYSNSSASHYY